MDTTPEIAAQVVILIQNGHSQRDVARRLHMTGSAVERICQRHEETASFNRQPGIGR